MVHSWGTFITGQTIAVNREERSEPNFVAELTPYRSLSRGGFFLLMAFVGATCFISGLMFWVAGAWPVFGFMGLDFLIIWFAFKMNYRAARVREVISVSRDSLTCQRYDPKGKMVEHTFNPFWTRFEVERHKEIGITAMRLTEKGRGLLIGSFLNPADRESFALEFSNALARAKN